MGAEEVVVSDPISIAEELRSWTIAYGDLLSVGDRGLAALTSFFEADAGYLWRDVYCNHFPRSTGLMVIELPERRYLYDCSWDDAMTTAPLAQEVADHRVVAAMGTAVAAVKRRDKSRMRGFPRGALGEAVPDLRSAFDRGHYLGRALGGGEDVNLFPQWAPVNRGLSDAGKVYRRMERFCGENPGVLFFSRPFYWGISDHPAAVEFGIVRPDATLWVNVFPNVPDLEYLRRLDEALVERRTTR